MCCERDRGLIRLYGIGGPVPLGEDPTGERVSLAVGVGGLAEEASPKQTESLGRH